MNIILEKLCQKCKNISNTKKFLHYDIYNEIIELICKSELDENIVKSILIELYRFEFYSEVKISLDPRGDAGFKLSVLNNLKTSIENGKLNNDAISKVNEANNFMREFIDSPLKFIEDEVKFYEENPYAKF